MLALLLDDSDALRRCNTLCLINDGEVACCGSAADGPGDDVASDDLVVNGVPLRDEERVGDRDLRPLPSIYKKLNGHMCV